MLEILLLIYLCRRAKNILINKGQKVGLWQLWIVLLWFGLEVGGMLIFLVLGSDLMISMLSGVLCAIGGSIALQRYIQSLPDINSTDQWLENLGKEDELS
jgi:hypothetical protein